MTHFRKSFFVAAFCAALVLCMSPLADAKRMGGGGSFGSRPTMQRSFTPTPQQAPQMQRQQTPTQQGINQQNPGAAQQPGMAQQPRRGLFGGMGGFLGGMLAGGLLGSLFFGGGFGGMPGILDMLLLALVAYGIFKFISMRRQAANPQPAAAGYGAHTSPSDNDNGWGTLRSAPQGGTTYQEQAGPEVPAGFDIEQFIKGAKMAFTRLQASWDKRDLEDISQFSTPAVLDEIRRQAEADPVPSTTEILLVNANLLGVVEENGQQTATVFFDVLLREDPRQDAPTSVREVWHFVRPVKGTGMWQLDGIQQVDQ